MRVLRDDAPVPRSDRASTTLLHDEPNARVIAFHLLAGQRVPPHRSDSTVLVQVVEGEGVFSGSRGADLLRVGDMAIFGPGEEHGIEAPVGPLRFVAILTPGPA